MSVKTNLAEIEHTITENVTFREDPTRPHVIAVTKYVTINRAKEAYEAGIRHFGENRIEGFLE
ncbi:YggS family pyridoxal phosphate enzyme, partial [Staphylococcus pseudintermedius]